MVKILSICSIFSDTGIGNYQESFLYAFAFSPKFRGNFGTYLEIFGQSSSGYNPLYMDIGISYAFSPSFIFDSAFAFALNDNAEDWQFQAGITTILFKIFNTN